MKTYGLANQLLPENKFFGVIMSAFQVSIFLLQLFYTD